MDKEQLQAQIDILDQLFHKHTIAYTGTLNNIKQGSYIPLGEITVLKNQKIKLLKKLQNERSN